MVTFWKLELRKDGKAVARELGRNALVLSGFSVTTLAFLLSQYQVSLLLAARSSLLSLALYFLVSELARNSVYYWEYAASDCLYVFASIVLFSTIAYVVYLLQLGVEVFALFTAVIALLAISLIYSLCGLRRLYKQSVKKR